MNAKHQQFINEYLKCWNATEAYRRVYPDSSDDAARSSAADLLANPSIAAAIQERITENAMSADEVLHRLGEQARAAYSEYIKPDGSVNVKKLVQDKRAYLIKGIKRTRYGKDIEFHDALAALTLIGKHHKLFVDRTENKTDHTLRVEYGDDGSNSEATEAT